MSARQSTFEASPHCSGAMYAGVPIVPIVLGELPARVPVSFAIPKSRTFAQLPARELAIGDDEDVVGL